jgi:hypothetical protein
VTHAESDEQKERNDEINHGLGRDRCVEAGANTPSTLAVNLGTAAGYAILAKSGISTVPTSAITGNLGVSPAAATYITGFSLTADPTNVFSTSPQVTGSVYAADYTAPTASNLTTAIGDMQLAVSGLVDLGTTAHIEGVILTQTSVALRTGASIKGRLLAQTAVTIDGSAVVQP